MGLPARALVFDMEEWVARHPCAICGGRFASPFAERCWLPICRHCRPPAGGPERAAFERWHGVDLRVLTRLYRRMWAAHVHLLAFDPEEMGTQRFHATRTWPRQIFELLARVPSCGTIAAADSIIAARGDLAVAEALLRLKAGLPPISPQHSVLRD